ncbi:MAG: alanine racemase, partial [Myxococcota bacterium]
MIPSYARYCEAVAGRRLPLAYVDLPLLDQNVDALAKRAQGLPVRVASKSIRCVPLLKRILRHPGFSGVMCYSAAEAAALVDEGLDDLLVAYPTLDEADLHSVIERIAGGARVILMVDDVDQVRRTAALAGSQPIELGLDVDMSLALPGLHFGVRRSPVTSVAAALRVARAIADQPSLRLSTVMGYEAQIAGVPDARPQQAFVNRAIRLLKRRSIPRLQALRGE